MARRAESGIRPGGEPQATDPHLLWVDLSVGVFRMSVYVSMQLRAQARVCREGERKPALKQSLVLALVA